ncbi:MAG: AEC family transporter, partial [Rhodoferax sp.]
LGALASAWQLALPKPLAQTVALLSDAASPVALFSIGAVLARAQALARDGHAPALHWSEYLPVAAIKLLLHPLLLWLLGEAAIRCGLPLERAVLQVLVLLAALPSASNVALLAERYGADNGRIASIILVSTAAAFFSFSAVVVLVTRV